MRISAEEPFPGLQVVRLTTPLRFDVYQISAIVGRGFKTSSSGTARRSGLPQISQVTFGGTFQTGASLYIALGASSFLHITASGDASLEGLAAAFAAVIDADVNYTATAAGSVVTITGPVGQYESLSAFGYPTGLLNFTLVQTAEPITAGVREKYNFAWSFLRGAANFLAASFSIDVRRISDGMFRSYTAINDSGSLDPAVFMPAIHNAMLTRIVVSGDKAAYDTDIYADPSGVSSSFYTPLATPLDWELTGVYCTDGTVSGSYARTGSGVAPIPVARPQIAKMGFNSYAAPQQGWIYRVILNGVNFDYAVPSLGAGPAFVQNITTPASTSAKQKVDLTLSGTPTVGVEYRLSVFSLRLYYTAVPGDTFASIMTQFASSLILLNPPAIYEHLYCTNVNASSGSNGAMTVEATNVNIAFGFNFAYGVPRYKIAQNLASLIDASADFSATAVGEEITITAAIANSPFTYAGSVILSSVTMTPVITQAAT